MKYLLTFSLVLLFAFGVFADTHKHDHDMKTKSDKAEIMKYQLKEGEACTMINVPTVQCEMCVTSIEKAVKFVDGVTMAKVNLETKKAHVHRQAENASVKDVEKAIAAAGYDANDMKRDENQHKKLPTCCRLER